MVTRPGSADQLRNGIAIVEERHGTAGEIRNLLPGIDAERMVDRGEHVLRPQPARLRTRYLRLGAAHNQA